MGMIGKMVSQKQFRIYTAILKFQWTDTQMDLCSGHSNAAGYNINRDICMGCTTDTFISFIGTSLQGLIYSCLVLCFRFVRGTET